MLAAQRIAIDQWLACSDETLSWPLSPLSNEQGVLRRFGDAVDREHDDMKSERMVIKSAELFNRIAAQHDSLRAFQRHLRGVVSLSTLSNWIKQRPSGDPWEAFSSKVEFVAEVLGCSVEDIASYPVPKPPPMNSRFLLRVALGGSSEQLMDLDVFGEELSLQERGSQARTLHGNVLTASEDVLTGHLRVFAPMVSAIEGQAALGPEEMTLQAKCEGDMIRGALLYRDRKGDISTARFEGIRKGISRRKPKRAAQC